MAPQGMSVVEIAKEKAQCETEVLSFEGKNLQRGMDTRMARRKNQTFVAANGIIATKEGFRQSAFL